MAKAHGWANRQAYWAHQSALWGTALAQQHLRNVLANQDMPTLGQPEAFIHAKEGLFDATGNFGEGSIKFMQTWMNHYVAWIKKHAALRSENVPG